MSRELVVPTFAQAEFVALSIEPRRAFLKNIIGQIVQRSPEDPLIVRSLLAVIAPCIVMSIINRPSLKSFLLDLDSQAGIEALVDHVERFVMAGLDAIAQEGATFLEPRPPATS